MWTEKQIKKALQTKSYLQGKKLFLRTYRPTYPNEHTFCAFCWCKISAFSEDINQAFFEPDTDSWVCVRCTLQFTDLMSFTVEEDEDCDPI